MRDAWEGANALAHIAHAATSVREFEERALEVARRAIAFDVGFWVRPSGIGPAAHGLNARLVRACERLMPRFARELEPVLRSAWTGPGVAVDVEVLGGDALRRTAVFRELMGPHGGRQTLLAPLDVPGRPRGLLALGRTGRTPFSARERRVLSSWRAVLSLSELAMQRLAVRDIALTAREREVLGYLRRGLTNREIALACGTAPDTVKNQLRAIFRKLGASTRAEAVAISLGFL